MIVGCDYSTKAIDFATRRPSGEWTCLKLGVGEGEIEGQLVNELARTLRVMANWTASGDRVIYVEQPWMNVGGRASNPATTMKMVQVATTVRIAAILVGYRAEWAHIATWRSAVFGKGKYVGKIAKERALAWSAQYTTLELGQDHNAADALCIAAYGEMKEHDRHVNAD